MTRLRSALIAFAAIAVVGPGVSSAQAPAGGRQTTAEQPPRSAGQPTASAPVVLYQNTQTAQEIQEQLREILARYPPSLRQVIQLDPTLLDRSDYIAAYPQLVAFLQQHPDVVRNPGFYFGTPFTRDRPETDRERTLNVIKNMTENIGFLAGFLTVVSLLYALLRHAIEYRRWRTQIRAQTEVHTKLLDRMTNNQELFAYLETSLGRRFLEAPALAAPASATAPVMRILWSVQIGVVVVAAGIGFWIARATVQDDALVSVFQVMGSLAVSVGVGFVASALLSWALSLRMGLMAAPAAKVD
jgi:hypothetical protein